MLMNLKDDIFLLITVYAYLFFFSFLRDDGMMTLSHNHGSAMCDSIFPLSKVAVF